MADRPLVLTPIEYNILLALARAVGRVKTREQLLREVAEPGFRSARSIRRCARVLSAKKTW